MNRVPPYDETAERAVLGCAVNPSYSVNSLALCVERGLCADAFYVHAHQLVYSACMDMLAAGRGIDILTLADHLKADGNLERVGGTLAIDSLIDGTPTGAHVGMYCEQVQAAHKLRRVIEAGMEAQEQAYEAGADADKVLADAQSALLEIEAVRRSKSRGEIKAENVAQAVAAKEGGTGGLPSPWMEVNDILGGLMPGCMTLVVGRTSSGKSLIAGNWARFLGQRGVPCALLPFEDGANVAWHRIAGAHGSYSVFDAQHGRMADADIENVADSHDAVMAWPIQVHDRHMNINQLCVWMVQAVARWGLKAVFLDAFKDILRTGRHSDWIREDERISQRLCEIARRLDIPIVVNCHVVKAGEDSAQPLTISDAKGAGQLFHDARQVIIWQQVKNAEGKHDYAMDIVKNSNGPVGMVEMDRQAGVQRIVSASTSWAPDSITEERT